MSRFIEVPATLLPAETLDALLEAFVTRQGYDTTDTTGAGMAGWVAEVKQQLQRGELVITHDVEMEMTEVMTLEQWQRFGEHIDDLAPDGSEHDGSEQGGSE